MAAKKPVTLKDIAAVADVSVSTVSKVLNGLGRVSPETRQRILDTADRLDFRPNALAQFFATGRSHTVALLAQKASGTFSMPVILGIMSRLAKDDIAAVVYSAVEDDVSGRPENIRKLHARQIDGVIVVGDGNDRVFPSISRSLAAPVVYAFGVSDDPGDTAFIPDDRQAGRLAATHLLETGRTRIAHVTGSVASQAVQRRLEGVNEVLEASGMPLVFDGPLYGDWTRESGRRAAARILERRDEVDAIICGNDFIAMGLSDELTAAGMRVPDDIAIVGHDNWEQYIGDAPFFTSVDPRLAAVGEAAAARLIEMADPGFSDEPGVHEIEGALVIGASS